MNEYIKLVKEGEDAASRCFEKKVGFQAYCEESDDNGRVLNVNLINHHGNEPTRISDILQQEKNIGKLNIYCNKKHEVHAHQDKDKKRYYVFEKGAYYQMTSTWPIKYESGRVVSTCTMVMNVSSDGITKILKFKNKEFNGEDYTLLSEEDKKLIEKNEELFIEGLPLCKAVGEFLKKQHSLGCGEGIIPIGNEERNLAPLPGIIPTIAHSSSQGVNQNKGPDEESKGKDLKGNAGSSPPPSSINSNASTPIGNAMQQTTTQTEVNSQDNETSQLIVTQTEVNSRDTETQTETTSKQITDLESKNQRLKEENTEYKQFIEAGLQEMNKKFSALEKEIQVSSNELKNISVEKEKSDQKLTEAEKETKELAAQNGNLLDKLKKKEQKSRAEKDKIYELLGHIQDPKYLQGIISGLQREQLVITYLSDERNMLGKSGTEDDFNHNEYIRQNKKLRLLDKTIELVKGLAGCILLSDDGYITDEEPDNTCSNSPVSTPTRDRMLLRTAGNNKK